MAGEEGYVPTPEDVLDVFAKVETPVLTANEVGEELGMSRRTALRWLKELEDEGQVGRKEVGARAVVWWSEINEDADRIAMAVNYLERALDDLPHQAPGRTAVKDALAELSRED